MQFGYFTLSDNRYPGNSRTPEQFIKDIFAEALWAEKVGLNSAWIGASASERSMKPLPLVSRLVKAWRSILRRSSALGPPGWSAA